MLKSCSFVLTLIRIKMIGNDFQGCHQCISTKDSAHAYTKDRKIARIYSACRAKTQDLGASAKSSVGKHAVDNTAGPGINNCLSSFQNRNIRKRPVGRNYFSKFSASVQNLFATTEAMAEPVQLSEGLVVYCRQIIRFGH